LSYFDPSDVHDTNVKGKYVNLVFHLGAIVMKNANDLNQLNKDSFYSKASPAKIDYEKISPYFAFRPHGVIQHTLRQTTQLAKSTIHYPMRRHLKSRFQMLRNKRLNEIITTDTYFANEKSIEGYHCVQVFFGMTSKILYVAGMKTEPEFADVNLEIIRICGIPSALRRDNAKSEMSQRVKDIHRDLIIADQRTEPHSPWQNSVELNGLNYLKSHAQVLLDRSGTLDNLWFLAQYSLAHFHNLNSYCQLNCKIPEQVSRGGDTRHISYPDVYWFEPVLYLDPVSKFQYPEITERPRYFVEFANNVGDALTFKILKNSLVKVYIEVCLDPQ
jgi:hypothetical protein